MTPLERTSRRVAEPSFVLGLLAAFCFATFLIRLSLPDAMRLDEAQQVFLAQWLAVGYDAQPPLYNWVQQAVLSLIPDNIIALGLLKAVTLWAIFASYYWLARLVIEDARLAAMATFGLLLTPQMFWEAQRDLTHTTGTLLMTTLLLLAIIGVIKRPSVGGYALIGACIGLGMLTKYNFALTLPAMAIATLTLKPGRQRLLDPRILVSALVALVIVAPHALWMLQNMDIAVQSNINKMARGAQDQSRLMQISHGLASLAGTGIAIIAPFCVIIGLVFGRPVFRAFRASDAWSRFFGAYLLAVAAELVLLVLLTKFTLARDNWLFPFLYLFPIYACSKLRSAGISPDDAFRRLVPVALSAMVLIPVALFLAATLNKSNHYFEPYRAFAEEVRKREAIEPSLVVADSWHLAGNMTATFAPVPVVATSYPNLRHVVTASREHPVLMVWRGEGATALPPAYRAWIDKELGPGLPDPQIRTVTLPYATQTELIASPFNYVVIYPR